MGENFGVSGPGFVPGAPPLNSIDTGVFINELTNLGLLPDKHEIVPFSLGPETTAGGKTTEQAPVPDTSQEVTYRGTQLALLKTYEIIEHRHHSFMEVMEFDSSLPPNRPAEEKRKHYLFTRDDDVFPPHLKLVGRDDEASKDQRLDLPLDNIFDSMRLTQAGALMRGFLVWYKRWAASEIARWHLGELGTPDEGKTLKEVEDYNKKRLEISKDFKGREQDKPKNDIFDKPNVGELEDWYSDAAFAQQQLTGVNPTTIKQASDEWLDHFIQASNDHEDHAITDIIKDLKNSSRESLYMQDYSYFRKAAGMDPAGDIKQYWKDGVWPWSKYGYRYNCASVCLYYLNETGQLYPLAIVIDWRDSARDSVTIFNRTMFKSKDLRTGADIREKEHQLEEEKKDWPWRYAKTCVQSSDWFQHEVTAHLTNTHFIEEAIIVASNRQFDDEHAVLQLLRPHWRKTLALNQAARSTLVPHVVLDLVGFSDKQASKFIWDAYTKFDFKENYVPTELKNRGFPPEKLGDGKFHNYAYAKCINSMWWKIRKFVKGILAAIYGGPGADDKIKADKQIQAWVEELQNPNGANLKTFPEIKTFDELVDCVTMCIHIASPQHTAVNYLQNYYLSFVVNKPPCLFEEPPKTLEELLRYTEQDLVKALPMNQPAEWLLASHIPYLLNKNPDNDETLRHYAQSAAGLFRTKQGESDQAIAKAATDFLTQLDQSKEEFENYAKEVDSWENLKYQVLYPESNAVSILI
ncbi:hypothetical protein ASPVEDRAFT_165036 [Aspergillus versicolor CBS 583.65]|uniref:Manganese lipoxygenase n=1 Tax=Aspergillus versicolor CBS 583.65 TaxID=1036611 RepID=A0A1L9PFL6_ASPVE|nr:uncharacterized protein ASPVEDRAFT_165036 [Aspergillus versicolor CBS 583.65]OJJ00337.1 hypothetical protein ASPVEDRAFT_165036 [Aspergillus versicolor CBS 583.65]